MPSRRNTGSPADPTPPLWDAGELSRTWRSRPTDDQVAKAARALAEADRPVIISGNGVHAAGAYEALADVAEAYGIVVTTSYLGKSTIPETHPLAAGVIGSFGHEGANRAVSEADVLLVVGSRLNPMDVNWTADGFIRPDEQIILHADIDPRNAGWVYPADVGLIGDAKATLDALLGADATPASGGIGLSRRRPTLATFSRPARVDPMLHRSGPSARPRRSRPSWMPRRSSPRIRGTTGSGC